jgi:hypothetical protein
MKQVMALAIVGSMFLLACSKEEPAGTAGSASPAAASPAQGDKAGAPPSETPCEAVVQKLASYETSAGEPEKKLWGKMCEEMSQEERACVVASKSADERDACIKDKKLQ